MFWIYHCKNGEGYVWPLVSKKPSITKIMPLENVKGLSNKIKNYCMQEGIQKSIIAISKELLRSF